MDASAKRALTQFRKEMDKTYGEGVMRLGSEIPDYTVHSTSSIGLDQAMGVGGIVQGKIHEFYGAPGVGKSTVAFLGMADYLKRHPNKVVAIIDMEHSFDRDWGRTLDMDMDRVLHLEPTHAEDVSDMTRMAVRTGVCGIVTLDSVGGMASKVEHEKEAEEAVVGTVAKVVTRMVNTITPVLRRNESALVIINQLRANIGGYGKDTDTGGGFALKHGTTIKVEFRTGEPFYDKIDGKRVRVGHTIKARVERNKVAAPYKTAEFVLFHTPSQYGPVGIDKADEAATFSEQLDFVEKAGSWYSLPEFGVTKEAGNHLNGREALREWFRDNPQAIEVVRKKAIAAVRGTVFEQEQE